MKGAARSRAIQSPQRPLSDATASVRYVAERPRAGGGFLSSFDVGEDCDDSDSADSDTENRNCNNSGDSDSDTENRNRDDSDSNDRKNSDSDSKNAYNR